MKMNSIGSGPCLVSRLHWWKSLCVCNCFPITGFCIAGRDTNMILSWANGFTQSCSRQHSSRYVGWRLSCNGLSFLYTLAVKLYANIVLTSFSDCSSALQRFRLAAMLIRLRCSYVCVRAAWCLRKCVNAPILALWLARLKVCVLFVYTLSSVACVL